MDIGNEGSLGKRSLSASSYGVVERTVHAQGVEKQNMGDRVRGSETARYNDLSIDDS